MVPNNEGQGFGGVSIGRVVVYWGLSRKLPHGSCGDQNGGFSERFSGFGLSPKP